MFSNWPNNRDLPGSEDDPVVSITSSQGLVSHSCIVLSSSVSGWLTDFWFAWSFSSQWQQNLGKYNSCESFLIRMYCILTKMYELDRLVMRPVFISYHSISISFRNWKGIENTVSLCIYWYWVLFPSSWLTSITVLPIWGTFSFATIFSMTVMVISATNIPLRDSLL